MTRIKFALGLLCTYAAYYSALILWDHLRHKHADIKSGDTLTKGEQKPGNETGLINEKKTNGILIHDTVLRSLWAYDNSGHKNMVHVRFDKQTVDLMNKFKMATGVDITKFVVFAVKYFFETNPELKNIIKQYIQNTEL
ncbi:MAG: hypothetical protein NVSMB24_27540 [Mucilaginibacter sp.]